MSRCCVTGVADEADAAALVPDDDRRQQPPVAERVVAVVVRVDDVAHGEVGQGRDDLQDGARIRLDRPGIDDCDAVVADDDTCVDDHRASQLEAVDAGRQFRDTIRDHRLPV